MEENCYVLSVVCDMSFLHYARKLFLSWYQKDWSDFVIQVIPHGGMNPGGAGKKILKLRSLP